MVLISKLKRLETIVGVVQGNLKKVQENVHEQRVEMAKILEAQEKEKKMLLEESWDESEVEEEEENEEEEEEKQVSE